MKKQFKEEQAAAAQLLEDLCKARMSEKQPYRRSPILLEPFLEVLRKRIQTARKEDDTDLLQKLQQITARDSKVSAPGANIELIEALIQAEDDADSAILEENGDEITDEFIQF